MADSKLTALTATTSPATTDVVYIVTDPAGTPASKKVAVSNLPLGFGAWTDYSSTSTVVGWGSTTVKKIYYKKSGKIVYVAYEIAGESNSATTTFTLADTAEANPSSFIWAHSARDNGGAYVVALAKIAASGATVTLYKDGAFTAFTNTGTKEVYGQFWYVAA